jgi:TonB family protein
MFIRQDGDAQKTMKEFYSYVDAPVLTDIQLQFKGVEISDAEPCNLPDLFAGQPLSVIAKYDNPGNAELTIEGNLAGNQKFCKTIDVVLPKEEKGNGVLATLWARKKIAEIGLLGSQMMGNIAYTPDSVKEKITRLGLTYRIMTEFTSFVAVDDAIRNKSGNWVTRVQAVDLPEGVSPASQPDYRYYGSQDTRARVARTGALGVISGKCMGAGIGYGGGYGSGYGGGASSSSVDALLQGMGGLKSYRGSSTVSRGSPQVSEPKFIKGATLTGGRSRAGIMRVVMQNIASLKYEYNKRLREKPGLAGKVVVKFVVDPKGSVILCEIVESTMKDPDLEKRIIEKMSRWVFDKVDDKIGTTEVVYPFVFGK